MSYNRLTLSMALAAGSAVFSLTSAAMPVNGTGDLVSNVIFGSGNFDGSFTGVNTSSATGGVDGGATAGVELALRGKLRFDNSNAPNVGGPVSVYNYDGVDTYTFSPADGVAPANRSVFNIDWSVNSDPNGAGATNLGSYIFGLFFDYDPTASATFSLVDFVFPELDRDHSFGTNATPQGDGEESDGTVASYESLRTGNNVAQNSWNAGFGAPVGFDPQTQGVFSAQLAAYSPDQFAQLEGLDGAAFAGAFLQADPFATAEIDIVFGEGDQAEVPVPAPMALLGLGLTALGAMRGRRA